MNGRRMNQFVAPTSFITSISRRLANIAVRIVFQISSTVAASRASGDGQQRAGPKKLRRARRVSICWPGKATLCTFGSPFTVLANWVSTSVFWVSLGTTLKNDGILSGPSCDSVGGVAAEQPLGVVHRAGMSQYVDLVDQRRLLQAALHAV